MADEAVITLDIDWAPDFVIDAVADILIRRGVKASWFITHDSPAVRRLMTRPELFDLGLHPNFLPGSSHGNTVTEVFASLLRILPEARSMRTHGLVQSTTILAEAAEIGITIDVSIYMPHATHLAPHHFRMTDSNGGLVRIPYYWEDDIETLRQDRTWRVEPRTMALPGLKVFDFHPIHVFLNTDTLTDYTELKRQGDLPGLPETTVGNYVNRTNRGTGDLFRDLLEYVVTVQGSTYTVRDIAEAWKDGHENRHSRTYTSAV
ncbi:MAG: hypothetical protein KKA42_16480 [candidate division Zixibacteria bacterium]|nr:hypothetical protein [candidate division Zixibacteria bacterium]